MADDLFREVTLRLCGHLDIQAGLSATFAYLRTHLPIEAAGLGFSSLATRRIEVVARAGLPDVPPLWVDDAGGLALNGAGLEYVRNENAPSPLVVNRFDDVPDGLQQLFPGLRTSSAIFVRLQLSSEDVGALLVWARGQDRFAPEHAALLEALQEPLTIAMVNARRYRELLELKETLTDDNRALSEDIRRAMGQEVVGADFGLRQVMAQVRQMAPSPSPVLLLGETGTGKEVIANALHMASPRSTGPFVSLQCGAIPDALLDSELFGHEKGAFTGALQRKRGRFERAHGGTLFLDEIGELSPEAQVKLLRVLQERRLERLGGTSPIDVDVRVVAATHRDLERMVQTGAFREDLWYRLAVLPVRLPPLRARREDIPSLVQYFVARKAQEMSLPRPPPVTSSDLSRLQAYDWPGNVRELQNVVERALILSSEGRLRFPELGRRTPPPLAAPVGHRPTPAAASLDDVVEAHIRAVLERTRWKISGPGGAAEVLAMNPSTLRFRMQKLGIVR